MPTIRERDFVAFFNGFWYRDFPTVETFEDVGRRAVWTAHIGSVIKRCADMMGAFTCYETGNRTDAVIQLVDPNGPGERATWAWAEWEWIQAHKETVNEIGQLAEACSNELCEVAIFVGYCRTDKFEDARNTILEQWKNVNEPLLCFLITFKQEPRGRRFLKLYSIRFYKNRQGNVVGRRLRDQPALPWEVEGSRWGASRQIAKSEDP